MNNSKKNTNNNISTPKKSTSNRKRTELSPAQNSPNQPKVAKKNKISNEKNVTLIQTSSTSNQPVKKSIKDEYEEIIAKLKEEQEKEINQIDNKIRMTGYAANGCFNVMHDCGQCKKHIKKSRKQKYTL